MATPGGKRIALVDWELHGLYGIAKVVQATARHTDTVAPPRIMGGAGAADEYTRMIAPNLVPEREDG